MRHTLETAHGGTKSLMIDETSSRARNALELAGLCVRRRSLRLAGRTTYLAAGRMATEPADVARHVRQAKLAERTHRYEDMLEFMVKVHADVHFPLLCALERDTKLLCWRAQVIDARGEETLNGEERDLLSLACKNVIGSLRYSWRALHMVIIDTDSAVQDVRAYDGGY